MQGHASFQLVVAIYYTGNMCMLIIMAAEHAVEYCSCTANVMGVKFYKGLAKLQPMMNVRVKRESGNVHDANAIIVQLKSGEILGHLEKR